MFIPYDIYIVETLFEKLSYIYIVYKEEPRYSIKLIYYANEYLKISTHNKNLDQLTH